MSKKPLCEVVGDKERHEESEKEDGVTIKVPTTKPVSVNVTVKGEPEKKEESKQVKKQLLG